jgi:hypothetical protein
MKTLLAAFSFHELNIAQNRSKPELQQKAHLLVIILRRAIRPVLGPARNLQGLSAFNRKA